MGNPTCFNDLMGCLGFSPFKSGPSPLPCESLLGLLRIFTVGIGGTYCDLTESSPRIIILVGDVWFDVELKIEIKFDEKKNVIK